MHTLHETGYRVDFRRNTSIPLKKKRLHFLIQIWAKLLDNDNALSYPDLG